jgi:CelD/BcsL family acetyltransferase involved in cellulose biosynthesis
LASESDNLRSFYQTPTWCAHKALAGERIDVAVLRDTSAKLIGLAPLLHTTFRLTFTMGMGEPWAKPFRGLQMLGNQPLLSSSVRAQDELFRAIRGTFPDRDCLCLGNVPLDSGLWEYLENSAEIRSFWRRYLPQGGPVRHYWLSLPSTFAEYLAKFGGKTRQTVKRQVNLLKRHGNGSLDLVRVESSSQVSEFIDSATAVAASSWQQRFLDLPLETPFDRARSLHDLADQNLLRAYVLKCAGRPCAYVLGFQLGSTYLYYETAYDPQFAHRSPGKVLLFLLLEDLFSHNQPQRLSFCPGDFAYKALFGTSVSLEADLVLFRRTSSNRAWCGSHRLFRGAVHAVKYIRGRKQDRSAPEGDLQTK